MMLLFVCLVLLFLLCLFVVETDKVLKERYLIGQNNAIYNYYYYYFFDFFWGVGFFIFIFIFLLIN